MSDYKRLTERSGKGICIKETSTNDNKSIWNAIERLAELEDMIDDGRLWLTPSNGLRPNPYECAKRWEELWYEANCQLNTLKDKIENGTLIELPCKVGDTIYWISSNNRDIIEVVVNRIAFVEHDRKILYVAEKGVGEYSIMFVDDMYTTKAEAEARLRELKGE